MEKIVGIIFWTICWVNLSWAAAPVIPNRNITSVAINPTSINIHSGAAFYFTATVQGTNDYDRDLTWSLQPANAGLLTANGLFIASSTYTGPAQVTATSVGNTLCLDTALATVTAGDGVWHVDSRNAGDEDGSARFPYRRIQSAVTAAAAGDTIKVTEGTYEENILLPNKGMISLGGFKGGSAADYQSKPGDFDTRDRSLYVTTISSPTPNRTTDAISMAGWYSNADTYVIDGFTITKGQHGIYVSGVLTFFISDNYIVENGVLEDSYFSGGGIFVSGVNVKIFNNTINNNQAGRGGGLYVGPSEQPFVIAKNTFENNLGGADHAGGVFISGLRGIFTKNLVRNNKANQSTNYGWGGGLLVVGDGFSPTPDPTKDVELSYNIYTGNEAKTAGGGVFIDDGCTVRMKHELIFQNTTAGNIGERGAAGLYVDGPLTELSISHCTITDNQGAADTQGNGISVELSATVAMTNSILWGNAGTDIYNPEPPTLTVTYSDSQPLYAGTRNISQDPLFADAALNDYHLKSPRGRWHPASNTWVKDAVHSPGIDAGNPAAEFVNEPLPNGSRANMGAYGNTYEASKSNRVDISFVRFLLLD